jgi:hypothetical protein
MININNSIDDNYRYKMPKAAIKLGGNGNGIFTTINNIDEISNAINTPPEILYKAWLNISELIIWFKQLLKDGYYY